MNDLYLGLSRARGKNVVSQNFTTWTHRLISQLVFYVFLNAWESGGQVGRALDYQSRSPSSNPSPGPKVPQVPSVHPTLNG